MPPAVHIVGIGARTPVGLQAPASAAAVRAGITRLAEHPFMVDHVGDLMPAAMDDRLDPGLMGPDRFVALAQSALKEACTPVAGGSRRLRLPVFLALPEMRPGFGEADAAAIRAGLARIEGLPVEITEVTLLTQGHAAGFLALAAALEKLEQGALAVCLVGGVESYFQPDTMEWLDENLQLAGSEGRSSFVPGEGAGFCLLANEPACLELGLGRLARALKVATAKETKLIKTADICLGEGLTTVVRKAAGGLRPPGERINAVICDINGERYRGEEWGFVCLRMPEYFDDPTDYLCPAQSWGDMGAASAPLFASLACQAAARGYAKGPRTLLWASSEGGLRGAMVLECAKPGPQRAN